MFSTIYVFEVNTQMVESHLNETVPLNTTINTETNNENNGKHESYGNCGNNDSWVAYVLQRHSMREVVPHYFA